MEEGKNPNQFIKLCECREICPPCIIMSLHNVSCLRIFNIPIKKESVHQMLGGGLRYRCCYFSCEGWPQDLCVKAQINSEICLHKNRITKKALPTILMGDKTLKVQSLSFPHPSHTQLQFFRKVKSATRVCIV